MTKYVKKPIEIEAFRIGYEEAPSWFVDADECIPTWGNVEGCNTVQPIKAVILTLEGSMQADHGDYIIKGIKGEIYPCKADIFQESYNRLDEIFVMKAYDTVKPEDLKAWSQRSTIIPCSE
jgi:hypothetical protein